MTIFFENFRLFYTVAKHLNISKAAEELHLSQPTVTKELRQFEAQIGMPLFVRHSRGVRLTPEGEYLYQRVKPAIRNLLETEAEVERLNRLEIGTVRISYNNGPAQHAMQDIIALFQEQHPHITIQSSIIPRESMPDALCNGVVELAFAARPGASPVPPPIRKRGSDLIEYSLGMFNDIFMVSGHLRFLAEQPVRMNALSGYPFIFQRIVDDSGMEYYQKLIRHDHAIRMKNLVMDDTDAIFSILKITDYIAVVPFLSVHSIGENADLFRLQVVEPTLSVQYLMHYSKQRQPSLAAMKLVEFILRYKIFTPEEIECSV